MNAAPQKQVRRARMLRWVAEVGAKYLALRQPAPPALPPAPDPDDDPDFHWAVADRADAQARDTRHLIEWYEIQRDALEGAKARLRELETELARVQGELARTSEDLSAERVELNVQRFERTRDAATLDRHAATIEAMAPRGFDHVVVAARLRELAEAIRREAAS